MKSEVSVSQAVEKVHSSLDRIEVENSITCRILRDRILSNGRCGAIIEASKMEKILYGFDEKRAKNESK